MNRQWRNAALAAVAAGLWLALAAPAFADDPCAGDIQSLCQGIPAGGARIYYCLKSNWNNLSDGCKATFDQANQLAREVSLDCQADVFSWCQGVPPGQGRILSCLISHYDDLSRWWAARPTGTARRAKAVATSSCPRVSRAGCRIVAR